MSGSQSVARHKVFDQGALDFKEVDAFQKIFNEMSNLLMDITERSNPRFLSKSDGFENWAIVDNSNNNHLILRATRRVDDDSKFQTATSVFRFLVSVPESANTVSPYLLFDIASTGFVHKIAEAYYDNNEIFDASDNLARNESNFNIALEVLRNL